eukprot:2690238-Rhodomonas_salina.1
MSPSLLTLHPLLCAETSSAPLASRRSRCVKRERSSAEGLRDQRVRTETGACAEGGGGPCPREEREGAPHPFTLHPPPLKSASCLLTLCGVPLQLKKFTAL